MKKKNYEKWRNIMKNNEKIEKKNVKIKNIEKNNNNEKQWKQ